MPEGNQRKNLDSTSRHSAHGMMIDTGCDEYDHQKNRTRGRLDRFHGKTARIKKGMSCTCCSRFADRIEVTGRSRQSALKDQIIGLTEVDRLFPTFDYTSQHTTSHRNLWETVPRLLENKSTKTTNKYDRHYRTMDTTYQIPIMRYVAVDKPPKNMLSVGHYSDAMSSNNAINSQWLLWRGRYYDPSKLYTVQTNASYTAHKLKELCPLSEGPRSVALSSHPFKSVPIPATVTMTDAATKSRLAHPGNSPALPLTSSTLCLTHYPIYDPSYAPTSRNPATTPSTAQNWADYTLTMDLRENTFVTHIGIRGPTPLGIDFPKRFYNINTTSAIANAAYNVSKGNINSFGGDNALEDDEDEVKGIIEKDIKRRNKRFRRRGYRRRRGSNRNGFVYVLQNPVSKLSYVTSVDVHYKHVSTGRWMVAGTSLAVSTLTHGVTETVIDLRAAGAFNVALGLRARFIRIVPKTWQFCPLFKVMAYGCTESAYAKQVAMSRTTSRVPRAICNFSQDNVDSDEDAEECSDLKPDEAVEGMADTVQYTIKRANHNNWMHDGEMYNYRYDRYGIDGPIKGTARRNREALKEGMEDAAARAW